jgi:sugar phosphate isomerase/epimerase
MEFCVFSKHFQAMDAPQLAGLLKEFGVDGADLTVRPGGHVEPERVAEELPRFADALGQQGLRVCMLTTSILGADGPHTQAIIETAARVGVRYIKLGYWRYKGFGHYREQAEEVGRALRGLEPILKDNGVTAGFHTHSGDFMGCNAEFALRLVEDCDPNAVGVYYDVGHCTIEGSVSGWLMGLDLMSDRLVMIAVKDMAWFRQGSPASPRKGWRDLLVPMDAGLVDWPQFVRCLKDIEFAGPISFHSEYQGSYSYIDMTQEQVVEQTRRDLAYLRGLLDG